MDCTEPIQTSESLLINSSPIAQVADHNSLLLKVEAIRSRLNILETQLGIAKPLRPVSTIPEAENLLDSIGVKLSDIEGYLASPHIIFKRVRRKGKYVCPAEN